MDWPKKKFCISKLFFMLVGNFLVGKTESLRNLSEVFFSMRLVGDVHPHELDTILKLSNQSSYTFKLC